jgi:hypothetical protein
MRPHVLLGQMLRAHLVVVAESAQLTPSYRHRYVCWACKYAGVLEFEPKASEPSWTECHHCGVDNEITAGLRERPTVIPGRVPSRIV